MSTVLRSVLVLILTFITLGVAPQIVHAAECSRAFTDTACSGGDVWVLKSQEARDTASSRSDLPDGWVVKTSARCSVRDMTDQYENTEALPIALDECAAENRCDDDTKTGYDVHVYDQDGVLQQTGAWCESDISPEVQARIAFARSTVPVAAPETEPAHRLVVHATMFFTARSETHTQTVNVADTSFLIRSTPV